MADVERRLPPKSLRISSSVKEPAPSAPVAGDPRRPRRPGDNDRAPPRVSRLFERRRVRARGGGCSSASSSDSDSDSDCCCPLDKGQMGVRGRMDVRGSCFGTAIRFAGGSAGKGFGTAIRFAGGSAGGGFGTSARFADGDRGSNWSPTAGCFAFECAFDGIVASASRCCGSAGIFDAPCCGGAGGSSSTMPGSDSVSAPDSRLMPARG